MRRARKVQDQKYAVGDLVVWSDSKIFACYIILSVDECSDYRDNIKVFCSCIYKDGAAYDRVARVSGFVEKGQIHVKYQEPA